MNSDDLCSCTEYEITRRLKSMTPEERARKMVDMFFELSSPGSELIAGFLEWLEAPFGKEAKEAAMERKFNEIINGSDTYEEKGCIKNCSANIEK